MADEENLYRTKLVDAEKDDKVKQEKPIRDFAKNSWEELCSCIFTEKRLDGLFAQNKDWIDG